MRTHLNDLRRADPAGDLNLSEPTVQDANELWRWIADQPPTGSVETRTWARPAPRHRRLSVALGAVAVLGVLGVLAIWPSAAPSHPARGRQHPPLATYTTPYREPRPLPSQFSPGPTSASSGWILTGDVVALGWSLHPAGPPTGGLTCPSLQACYVVGDSASPTSLVGRFDSLYFSGDEGSSWSAVALPAGFSFAYAYSLSCPSPQFCFGSGSVDGAGAFIYTSDGGAQWTVWPSAYSLAQLLCDPSGNCSGVTYGSAPVNPFDIGEPSAYRGVQFVHSVDGGHTWTEHSFPYDDAINDMSCPTASGCIVTGYSLSVSEDMEHFSALVFLTQDGGATWRSGAVPEDFSFDYIGGLSCYGTEHCMALGLIAAPNPEECGGQTGQSPPGPTGCVSGAVTLVSSPLVTDDGGLTWRLSRLPADVPLPTLGGVSCWGPGQCWVVGEEAVPQGRNGGSAVILGTVDDGRTWTKTTFTVPPGAPEDLGHDSYMAVGEIACPSSAGCLGLGVSDQGSRTTPVYVFRQP